MQGVIQGGTGYLWAAYLFTWLALAGYGASLWWRLRRQRHGR